VAATGSGGTFYSREVAVNPLTEKAQEDFPGSVMLL
jgi:hypothetical protein